MTGGNEGRSRRWLKWVVAGGALGFGLLQLLPLGRDHSNPPVVAEPAWHSPRTRELAAAACFDCHSNETAWPWYSNIAPMSWLVQRDVEEGREELNLSEWHREQDGEEAAEMVREGTMPPRRYLLLHPDARLTESELAELERGLAGTLGDEDEGEEEKEEEEEEDVDDD